MTKSSLIQTPYYSKITGTGSAFPKTILTNVQLADKIAAFGQETNDPWIKERTGIHERRVADPNNKEDHNSSLGLLASMHALEMAKKTPLDIDQIIYSTSTPDLLLPSTACVLQAKLGAKKASAFDVNAACSGFIYALSMADATIRSGQSKTTLIVGGDVLTSFVNWHDRGTCILFGDGAGAAVIEQTTSTSEGQVLSSTLRSDGDLWHHLYVEAGGSAQPVTPETLELRKNKVTMNGKEIYKVAVKTLYDLAVNELEKNNLNPEELSWFLPHQANLRIIEAVANRLKFPMDRVLLNIDRFGNTSSATVPTALDEAVRSGKIKKGDTILMDVFGAGVTSGAALIRW